MQVYHVRAIRPMATAVSSCASSSPPELAAGWVVKP